MNKFTYLLLLLFCMMGGVMNAQEQTVTVPEITTDTNNPICYTIKSKRSGKYLHSTGAKPDQTTKDDFCLWYVTKENTNEKGFQIVHYATGEKLQLDLNLGTNDATWFIFKNPYNDFGVVISKTETVTNSSCIDDQNGGIGFWTPSQSDNQGTTWIFEKTEKPTTDYTTQIQAVFKEDKLGSDNSYVGFINESQKVTIKAKYDEALKNPTIQSYETFKRTIEQNSTAFEANAYYLIENQNGHTKIYPSTQHMHSKTDGVFGVENNNDRNIHRTTANDPLLPRLWKVEKQGNGTYKFRSANTGCVWSSYVEAGIDMPIDKKAGGQYSIEGLPWNAKAEGVASYNTKFYIKIDGHTMNAFNADNGDLLKNWDHADDAGGFWSFKKVTEVPVTIGEAKWASVCMPFAVTLPEGVKAYKATDCQNNSMTLTEITGTIPAGTGFLLTGDAKDYMLTIATDEQVTADVSGNLLKGATAKRLGFSEGETFALGKSSNGAVFKKNGLKDANKNNKGYVPANKAYILSTDLNPAAQAAAMLQFNFGDNTTGIDGVEVDNEKETIYYDLNGRRVLYPTQGVYVTNTGKKVFIR